MMNDIDSLLDGTLDDLEDLPSFKPFPAGAHRCTIKFTEKKVNDKTAVEMDMVAVETMELSNPEDTPTKQGDKTGILFQFVKKDNTPNTMGQGQFKEVMKVLAAHFGAKSNRELMAEANGCEVLAVTVVKKNDKDPNDIKYNTGLVTMQVL